MKELGVTHLVACENIFCSYSNSNGNSFLLNVNVSLCGVSDPQNKLHTHIYELHVRHIRIDSYSALALSVLNVWAACCVTLTRTLSILGINCRACSLEPHVYLSWTLVASISPSAEMVAISPSVSSNPQLSLIHI